jgi:hypothetical protein
VAIGVEQRPVVVYFTLCKPLRMMDLCSCICRWVWFDWHRRVVLDPLVLPRQQPLRNPNADLLPRFEIDDELEFDRLLEENISWFDAVELF